MSIKLIPEDNRKNILPPVRKSIWNLWEKGLTQYWTPNEISFKNDAHDYKYKLNDTERHLIDCINGFFAQSDQLIVNVINDSMMPELSKIPEIGFWYSYKQFSEQIHVITYNRQIIETVTDSNRQHEILNSVQKMPAVTKLVSWINDNVCNTARDFSERVVATVCAEGILFSAQFAIIYWFQEKNVLMGTAQANELISRDENLHAIGEIAILKETGLYQQIGADKMRAIFKSAVSHAKEFVNEMFITDLPGLTKQMAGEYIEFVADYYWKELHDTPLYGTKNPFKFMQKISLPILTNFFEQRSTEYSMGGSSNSLNEVFEEADEF